MSAPHTFTLTIADATSAQYRINCNDIDLIGFTDPVHAVRVLEAINQDDAVSTALASGDVTALDAATYEVAKRERQFSHQSIETYALSPEEAA